MGVRLSTLSDARFDAPTPAQRVLRVVGMVRYRFFLYAGLLPYLLGAAWAHAITGSFDAALFCYGDILGKCIELGFWHRAMSGENIQEAR